MSVREARESLPATVIGGFLGAGKTTLLNRLLRQPGGRRIAVLVNDFGSVNIDAHLIESQADGVVNLANGCICCSMSDDLSMVLLDLLESGAALDHLVIEASGVAEPGRVRGYLDMVPGVRADGIVVVVDGMDIRRLFVDPQLGPLVRSQLQAADLLVKSKLDLVEAGKSDELRVWLDEVCPDTPQFAASAIPADVLLGPAAGQVTAPPGSDGDSTHPFVTRTIRFTGRVTRESLERLLGSAPPGLLRVKGFADVDGGEFPVVVNAVGPRWSLQTHRGAAEVPRELVLIGRREAWDRATLETWLCHVGLDRYAQIRD